MNRRSVDPADYQNVARPVAAMAKRFRHGTELEPHTHRRDQLLYAIEGIMRIRTDTDLWIVPPDRAVYVPRRTAHSVSMQGRVEMRTLYIASDAGTSLPHDVAILDVSDLLGALIVALFDEPVEYDPAGRGGMLAALILYELAHSRRSRASIPMPQDQRLAQLCGALLENPARHETLDQWADLVGASPRTIARLFKAELGLPFAAWRQRVRFHSAMEALSRGERITSVAHRSGYSNASAFTAAFRRAYGFPPSHFPGKAAPTG